MKYEDFVLHVASDRAGGFVTTVLKSPAGEGRGSFRFPFAAAEVLPEFERAVRESSKVRDGAGPAHRDLVPAVGAPAPRGLKPAEVGDALFRELFHGQVRTLYDQSVGSLAGAGAERGLRIKLKLDPGDDDMIDLAALPWEYLCSPGTRDFLALSRATPILRYLDVPRPAPAISLPPVLRVLVATANPDGLPRLDLEQESANVERALRGRKGVEVEVLRNAGVADLRRALLDRPAHVLHFMGHGGLDPATGEGVLYFEKEGGVPEPIGGRALATKLQDFKTLGLIFLNACNTARLGEGPERHPFAGVAAGLVHGGLPAVLAMQLPISDRAAIHFSGAFYQRLAAGDSVDEAVTEGRQAIHTANPSSLEWGTPVLFARVPDGTVFQKPERSAAPPSRWKVATLAALLLVLAWIFVPRTPAVQSFDLGRIDEIFATDAEGLTGRITTIELLDDGRMRLHFEFRNDSGSEQKIGFDYGATYLADPEGNRYDVLGAAAGLPDRRIVKALPAAGKLEHWIDFPAPQDTIDRLSVRLAGHEQSTVGESYLDVRLPREPPRRFVRRTAPPEPPPGARRIRIDQTLPGAVEDVVSRLASVELLNRRKMYWNFELWNTSSADRRLALDPRASTIVDELGNDYGVLEALGAGWELERGVRSAHWLALPAPIGGARRFTVTLRTRDGGVFSTFELTIPAYPEQYAYDPRLLASLDEPPPEVADPRAAPPPRPRLETPPQPTPLPEAAAPRLETVDKAPEPRLRPMPAFVVMDGETALKIDRPGLRGKLTHIDRLENGRLRWHFEFLNGSAGSMTFGFDLKATSQFGSGHQYRLLSADFEPDAETGRQVYRATLPSGAIARHWFEFSGLKEGARLFTVYLASHDTDAFRIRPLTIDLARY